MDCGIVSALKQIPGTYGYPLLEMLLVLNQAELGGLVLLADERSHPGHDL